MNKVILASDRVFMAVVGPSGSGKTELIFKMLKDGTFQPPFEQILYFYRESQPKFTQVLNQLNIQFMRFTNFDVTKDLENCLLIFDDSCEEIYNEKEFVKIATSGRHRNLNVIYVKHNLYQQSRWSRTIDLNTTHIILFKSLRDVQQIEFLGKQLNNAQFLKEAYLLATQKPYGHLLIDLDPKTSEGLRYCSNITSPGATIFYIPSSKAVVTTITNEKEALAYAKGNKPNNKERF